jgi:hypothetical protein
VGTGGSFSGDKAVGAEAQLSPPYSAEGKNGGARPLLPLYGVVLN